MKTIIIDVSDTNDYTIRVGDRYADHLTWDEMLGQIAYMTCPIRGEPNADERFLFRMATKEEWEAQQKAYEDRRTAAEALENFTETTKTP